jgi:hAT family C-terminal dimerisation region
MNDLQALKYCLIQLADDEGEMLQEINPKTNSAKVLSLIRSLEFWSRLAILIKDIEHPSKVIGKLESDNAQLSLVYHYFGEMFKSFENNQAIQIKIKKRLDFIMTPSIGLAYILTPKFAAEGFYFNDDKMDILSSLRDFASKTYPDIVDEIEQDMLSFVEEMSELPEKRKDFIFKMNAKTFWNIIGREKYPALYKVAQPIVEMICSSAISERVWSTFRFIHSRLRNRLTNDRVGKLVFIYSNSVLLDSMDQNDYILEEGAILNSSECE